MPAHGRLGPRQRRWSTTALHCRNAWLRWSLLERCESWSWASAADIHVAGGRYRTSKRWYVASCMRPRPVPGMISVLVAAVDRPASSKLRQASGLLLRRVPLPVGWLLVVVVGRRFSVAGAHGSRAQSRGWYAWSYGDRGCTILGDHFTDTSLSTRASRPSDGGAGGPRERSVAALGYHRRRCPS